MSFLAFQEFQAAQDSREKIVEIVCYSTGQLADCLQLLRLNESGMCLFKSLLRLMLLGNVARDLGEPDKMPRMIVERLNHNASPEPRAILADAPCLGFMLAGSRCLPEYLVGDTGLLILRTIEPGEMAADRLPRRIAFDPNSPRVPACDAAVGVQHENRVVLHAIHQPAERLFCFCQLGRGALT